MFICQKEYFNDEKIFAPFFFQNICFEQAGGFNDKGSPQLQKYLQFSAFMIANRCLSC